MVRRLTAWSLFLFLFLFFVVATETRPRTSFDLPLRSLDEASFIPDVDARVQWNMYWFCNA